MKVLAATAALFLASAAAAQTGTRYTPPYQIVTEDGADLAAASKGFGALKRLHLAFPALFSQDIVQKVVVVSPQRGLGNCVYCPADPGMVIGERTVCSEFSRAVVMDPEFLPAVEGLYPGFYRPGTDIEAVMFHELMHGWAYAHPDDLKEYGKVASDGRMTGFQRKRARVLKPIWDLERKMEPVRTRVAIGTLTREEYASQGSDDFGKAVKGEEWDRLHGADLEQAKAQLAAFDAQMDEKREKAGLKIERYNARKNAPRRDARDAHAYENEQEWFAYGAEIYFYSTQAEQLLTARERAWWAGLSKKLTAR
jgi:hypothetical protein